MSRERNADGERQEPPALTLVPVGPRGRGRVVFPCSGSHGRTASTTERGNQSGRAAQII